MPALVPRTVTGLRRDDNHFTTVVDLRWLIDNIVPGLALEDGMRDLEAGKSIDPRTAALAPMRKRMQRPFRRPRLEKRSVAGESVGVVRLVPTQKFSNTTGSLKDYLVKRFAVTPEEAWGVLPGFVAVWPETMDEKPLLGADVRGLPNPWYEYDFSDLGRGALADGECRQYAALLVSSDSSIDAALKDKLLNKLITVEIYHGITVEQAATMFVDLNYEGTAVDTITKANLDPRNKWIQATNKIFEELGMPLGTSGRQQTQTNTAQGEFLLLTHAEQMVKSIVLGPNKALKNSKRDNLEASWEGVDFDKLHAAAVRWFGAIFDYFNPEGPRGAVLADKSRVVRTVAVRVALASLGSAFYRDDFEGIKEATETLHKVNWVVSEKWNGIGGKVVEQKDGVVRMSAGSGKEHITAAVSAIAPRIGTRHSRAWRAVRNIDEPEDVEQSENATENSVPSA